MKLFRALRARVLAPVILTLVATSVVAVAPSASAAPPRPDIEWVEVHADHTTVTMKWTHVASVDGYEFFWRPDSNSNWLKFDWAHESNLNGSAVVELDGRYAYDPQPGQSYQLTMRTKVYSNGAVSPLATPATVTMVGPVGNLSVSAPNPQQGGSPTIDATWTPYPGQPFVSYNYFVSPQGMAPSSCYVGWDGAVATAGRTFATTCGGAELAPDSTYQVGVRAIQRQDSTGAVPNVWTRLATATVTTPSAQTELLQTAQVGSSWEIVDTNGQAELLNGVSVRRYEGGSTNQTFASAADVAAIKARGFNTIRVVMHWHLFEPSQGQWDQTSFGHLDQLVADAASEGLYIILDPIHQVNGKNLPGWAWTASGEDPSDKKAVMSVVGENAVPYLQYVIQRYEDEPQVVAIDLVNEIREQNDSQSLDGRMTDLMAFYHDLIVAVRAVDGDKPILLQPYYGSTRVNGNQLNRIDDPTPSDPNPDPADFTNLVWSLHDYYSGNAGGPSHDGYSGSGYTRFGETSADGMRWYNSWDTTSCYPAGADPNNCPDGSRRATELRPSMTVHVAQHRDAANAAGMPMVVGEYAIPHKVSGNPNLGWGGGYRYLQDKKTVYDSLGVSRIYWAFSESIDQTYGLYDPGAGSWHYMTDALFE